MKIILLNGPPRCGKDAAASILYKYYNPTWSIVWEKFSLPHKRAFAAMTGRKIDQLGNVDYYEAIKSETIPWLGVSYRQWQIDFSEHFMKLKYGDEIFARMFLERVRHRIDTERYLCLVSDCGFQIEVEAVAARWPIRDLMLITILRDNCTFENDSRQYVTAPDGVEHKVILNNDTLNDLKHDLIAATERWINQP